MKTDLADIFYVKDFINELNEFKQKYGNDVRMVFDVDISNLQHSGMIEKYELLYGKEYNLIVITLFYE